MKITLEIIKSRLNLIRDIETAAIYCEFEEDGITINQDEDVLIVFSIALFNYIAKKTIEDEKRRYQEAANALKEAFFLDNSRVTVVATFEPIYEDFGKFKKLDLLKWPDLFITKKELADRFRQIGHIKEAWILCETVAPKEFINYMYPLGIYIKLTGGIERETEINVRKRVKELLAILFNGFKSGYDLEYLDEDKLTGVYRDEEVKLDRMTKLL